MEFSTMGLTNQMGSIPLEFLPSQLPNLEFWSRFNQGITVTGSGVSRWEDVSGNNKDFVQATDTNRPSKVASGAVLCDGVDNFLFANLITLTQPYTSYLLVNTKTWTTGDNILGFGGGANRFLYQTGSTPQLALNNGAVLASISPVLDTYNVISMVLNGASSVLQLNNDIPVTGNAGATAGTSLAIGTNNQVAGFAHAEYKEVITFTGAHDAATRAQIINYLARVGGLSI